MENRSHALAAGLFVLVASALLVLMAFWLTRDSAIHRSFEMSSREAVTGLQPQAGVRYKGVTVGKVQQIGFDPVTMGNVLIRISTNLEAPITKSTFATLGFQGVTGLAFIQLDDLDGSKETLSTSDNTPARIPMRASLLSRLSDQGTQILVQLEESSRRFNQLLAPENQKELFATVHDIGQSAKGFNQAAASFSQFSSNANRILNAQFGPEKINVPKLVEEVGTTLKSLQATSQSVEKSAAEFQATAAEFKQVAKTVGQPGGPLDKLGQGAEALAAAGQSLQANTLPKLGRVADDAARTARTVSRTAAGVSDNPQALIYGNGPIAPGPGEPNFSAPTAKP